MNAIILTALWGVVMMFGGVFFKKPTTPKYWAIAGIIIILAANILEFFGMPFFQPGIFCLMRCFYLLFF